MLKLDLRDRCARRKCGKLIRKGKMPQAEFQRYKPYCSFHCQEWARLEDEHAYLATLPGRQPVGVDDGGLDEGDGL